jgi:hypothetical protein
MPWLVIGVERAGLARGIFGVDQLEHADDPAGIIFERDRQDRDGPVVVLAVKLLGAGKVEVVRAINIGNIDGMASESAVGSDVTMIGRAGFVE